MNEEMIRIEVSIEKLGQIELRSFLEESIDDVARAEGEMLEKRRVAASELARFLGE